MSVRPSRVVTAAAPAYRSHISQGIRVGDLLFLSGQTGVDPATGRLAEGMEGQTRQAFQNVKAVVEAAGGTLADVVAVTLYVADMSEWDSYNRVWNELFGSSETPPTRQSLQITRLFGDALVEVVAVAALPAGIGAPTTGR